MNVKPNTVNPDQTTEEQFDLGLQYLYKFSKFFNILEIQMGLIKMVIFYMFSG